MESELKKMKVAELRDELQKRGLDTKGVKDDLIQRLAAAMESEQGGAAKPAEGASDQAKVISGQAAADEQAAGDANAASAADEPAPAVEQPAAAAPADTPAVEAAAAKGAAGTAAAAAADKPAVQLTEAEKARLRAQRFGLPTKEPGAKGVKGNGAEKGSSAIGGLGFVDPAEELAARKKRAERFGLPVPTSKAEEEAKLRQRADRFGLPPTKQQMEEKKKARAERFGIAADAGGSKGGKAAAPAATGPASDEFKKKMEERSKRFANPASAEDEAKKKARAERFGLDK